MGERRKLQGEIDRVLKRIGDGIDTFEDIWEKVQNSSSQNQKEKHEQELKKEIKKLQRLRDQIKTWLTSNDIKDKTALIDARRKIENLMERFKVVERETKTKAYSKEGLGASQKLDPQQKEKDDAIQWITHGIESLKLQTDTAEAESETILATSKRKKDDKERQGRLEILQKRMDRNQYHMSSLEKILRLVDNDAIDLKEVQNLKDDVEFYIESNQDADFTENDEMYDNISFDDIPVIVRNSDDHYSIRISESEESSTRPLSSSNHSTNATNFNTKGTSTKRHKNRAGSHSFGSEGIFAGRLSNAENRHFSESNCQFEDNITPTSGDHRSNVNSSILMMTNSNIRSGNKFISDDGLLEYCKAKSSDNIADSIHYYSHPSLNMNNNHTGFVGHIESDTKVCNQSINAVALNQAYDDVNFCSANRSKCTNRQNDNIDNSEKGNITGIDIYNESKQKDDGNDQTIRVVNERSTEHVLVDTCSPSVGNLHCSNAVPPITPSMSAWQQNVTNLPSNDAHSSNLLQSNQWSNFQQSSNLLNTGNYVNSVDSNGYPINHKFSEFSRELNCNNDFPSFSKISCVNDSSNVFDSDVKNVYSFVDMPSNIYDFQDSTFNAADQFLSDSVNEPVTTPSILNEQTQRQSVHSYNNEPISLSKLSCWKINDKESRNDIGMNYLSGQLGAKKCDQSGGTTNVHMSSDYKQKNDNLSSEYDSYKESQLPNNKSRWFENSSDYCYDPNSVKLNKDSSVQEQGQYNATDTSAESTRPVHYANVNDTAKLYNRRNELMKNAFAQLGSHVAKGLNENFGKMEGLSGSDDLLSGRSNDLCDIFSKLSTEALFFIFYYMGGTSAQYAAAKLLKSRSWRFHLKFMMWFQRHEQPKSIREDCEQGTYIYFDFEKWVQKKKEGFTFEYKYLEDREFF